MGAGGVVRDGAGIWGLWFHVQHWNQDVLQAEGYVHWFAAWPFSFLNIKCLEVELDLLGCGELYSMWRKYGGHVEEFIQ